MNLNHGSHFIWILVVYTFSLLIAFFYSLLSFSDINRQFKMLKPFEYVLVLLVFIMFSILFGVRPFDIGTDTSNYVTIYNSEEQGVALYDSSHVEPIFLFITKVFSYFLSVEGYFIAISMLIFMPISYYIYKVHREHFAVVTFYLFSLFTAYSLGMNIIRNGLAVGMLFMSLICYRSRNTFACYLFLILAYLFHSSSLLWIIAFTFVIMFHKANVKWYFIWWVIASVISYSNFINASIIDKITIFLPEFSSDKLATYTEVTDYRTGFRLDFWFFSLIFVGSFYYYRKHINGRLPEALLKLFLLLNSIFILMFFLPYNDRFGLLSYILIPSLAGFIYQNKDAVSKLSFNFFFLFLGIYSIFFQLINAYK